jgi:hypothetical protein
VQGSPHTHTGKRNQLVIFKPGIMIGFQLSIVVVNTFKYASILNIYPSHSIGCVLESRKRKRSDFKNCVCRPDYSTTGPTSTYNSHT